MVECNRQCKFGNKKLKFLFVILLVIALPVSAAQKSFKYSDYEEYKNYNSDSKYTYNITEIISADSFIGNGVKLRLWGIKAPQKGEPYYKNAAFFLEATILNTDLQCTVVHFDKEVGALVKCVLGENDLGRLLVRLGMAEDYKKDSYGEYQIEQLKAQADNLGIWKH